ncbi:MAG: LysE family transporter [Cytophagaceae bacterium]|nr:LysE family transporter [Cytophagaceae bacterium]
MTWAILEAVLLGFSSGTVMCLTLGTVFFSLIQNSVDNGYRSGVKVSIGVIVSDSLFIFFAVFGTSFLPQFQHFDTYLRCFSALLLLLMGAQSVFRQAPRIAYPKTRFGNFVYYFGTGFLLNALNPANFVIWVSVSAYLNGVMRYSLALNAWYFGASLVAIFATQVFISVFAHRLKQYFNERILTFINKLSGSVFMLAGGYLVYVQLTKWLT